jgi:hypothetical protein
MACEFKDQWYGCVVPQSTHSGTGHEYDSTTVVVVRDGPLHTMYRAALDLTALSIVSGLRVRTNSLTRGTLRVRADRQVGSIGGSVIGG